MKLKVLHHDPAAHERKAGKITRYYRNPDPQLHPFERAREYNRALVATKLDKMFAKPLVAVLDGHTDAVKCMARSHKRVADLFTASCDGELRFWNMPTRTCTKAISAHDGFIRGLCVSPDDRLLFTGGDDKCIKTWKVEKNEGMTAMDWDEVLDEGNLVRGEEIDTSKLAKEVPALNVYMAKSAVTSLDHHWSRHLLVSTGDTVDIWDHHRSAPIQSFEWGCDSVICARFNPAEPCLIASTASDNTVGLYDLRGSSPIRKVLLKMRSNAVSWNPMEPLNFTVANEDCHLYTFDMRKLDIALNLHRDFTNAVLDVDYSPSGREFVAASYDRTIRIFRVSESRSREVYHAKRMQRVLCCRFTADTRYVVSGSEDTNVRVWKAEASKPLGPRPFRERQAMAYRDALKRKFQHLKEIRRIARHRHVPSLIKKHTEKRRIMAQAKKRKEENLRRHSRPGAVPFESVRRKPIKKQIE
ncbi:unnamed protein product [Vitrella brassicaformis CCMP3155]|uniref:DDB1- and CUL4-associated factor 13 n=2 Tax=Vitrella brassicaformis TaxID=1169539 RepID=A0A0G4FNT0_VITBC|nr:unnamed protein product [Vitrella brassicaformis CCMP3155]|eukprot:CEM15727.1 unnamed protein product [Vitrella brassicaformis CCMP3155]